MADIPPPGHRHWCAGCWSRHNGGHIVGTDHADGDGCDGCGGEVIRR